MLTQDAIVDISWIIICKWAFDLSSKYFQQIPFSTGNFWCCWKWDSSKLQVEKRFQWEHTRSHFFCFSPLLPSNNFGVLGPAGKMHWIWKTIESHHWKGQICKCQSQKYYLIHYRIGKFRTNCVSSLYTSLLGRKRNH